MTYIVGWCKFFNVCLNKLVLGLWQIDLPLVWTLKLCKFMECHGLGLAVKQLESLSELCPCLYVNLEWLIGVKRLWDTDLLASLDFARKEHCSFLLFFSFSLAVSIMLLSSSQAAALHHGVRSRRSNPWELKTQGWFHPLGKNSLASLLAPICLVIC